MTAENWVLYETLEILWIDFRIPNWIYSLKAVGGIFSVKIERELLVKNIANGFCFIYFLTYRTNAQMDTSQSKSPSSGQTVARGDLPSTDSVIGKDSQIKDGNNNSISDKEASINARL